MPARFFAFVCLGLGIVNFFGCEEDSEPSCPVGYTCNKGYTPYTPQPGQEGEGSMNEGEGEGQQGEGEGHAQGEGEGQSTASCEAMYGYCYCHPGSSQCRGGSTTTPTGTLKTLVVKTGFQFQGTMGQPDAYGWPIGAWTSMSNTFTWGSNQVAAFNVQGLDHFLRPWAIQGQQDVQGGWCAQPDVDRTMFVGSTPEQMGCTIQCSRQGFLNWLCPR